MNKADLVAEVKKQLGAECSKAHAERAVNALLTSIQKGLRDEGEVQIVGFGTFAVRERKPRAGSHPRTGQPIQIKASRTVGFRPGTSLRDSL